MWWHLDYLACAFLLETLKSCQYFVFSFLCISCKVALREMAWICCSSVCVSSDQKSYFFFFNSGTSAKIILLCFIVIFFTEDVSLRAVSISRNDMQIADSVLESLSVFYEIKKVTWKFTVFLLLYEESSDCMCVCVWSAKKAGVLWTALALFSRDSLMLTIKM